MKQYIVYKQGVSQTHDISLQHAAKNLDNWRYRNREELKDDKKPATREEKNFLSNENDTPTPGQPKKFSHGWINCFVSNKVYKKKILFFILETMSKITLNLFSSKKSSKKIDTN